jgi:hypothetical protein
VKNACAGWRGGGAKQDAECGVAAIARLQAARGQTERARFKPTVGSVEAVGKDRARLCRCVLNKTVASESERREEKRGEEKGE